MTRKRSPVPTMRGVSAFLSTTQPDANRASNQLPLTQIHLPAQQPRRYFDPTRMQQLQQSIQRHGILEPLLVRPVETGYELVAGERRYRAAEALGLTEVPVHVCELNDQEALQVALIENLQREDLNPVEETEGILDLLSLELKLSRAEIISLLNRAANAKKRDQDLTKNVLRQLETIEELFAVVGRMTPDSFRTARLPLLNLPEEVLAALRTGQIAYTKAQAIARVKPDAERQQLLADAIAHDLSLNEIKQRIAQIKAEAKQAAPITLQDRIAEVLKKVRKSKAIEDPRRQRKLEKLLAELEALAGSD